MVPIDVRHNVATVLVKIATKFAFVRHFNPFGPAMLYHKFINIPNDRAFVCNQKKSSSSKFSTATTHFLLAK